MSTTFDVYPSTVAIPTFGDLLSRANRRLDAFLQRAVIASRPELTVTLKSRNGRRDHTIQLFDKVTWPDETYAWFYVPDRPGGCEVHHWRIDHFDREYWENEFTMPYGRYRERADQMRRCLAVGHTWRFQREDGQPAIIDIAYGLLAASLAELTGGLINTSDGAWDYQHFPATAAEFDRWYFLPDQALADEYREWAEAAILSVLAEFDFARWSTV